MDDGWMDGCFHFGAGIVSVFWGALKEMRSKFAQLMQL